MRLTALRWDEITGDTALARLVRPYRDWFDPDDSNAAFETALDGHLVGNGLIQLFNPGYDEHFIGLDGVVPWFGYGHCALLAWHLHQLTGWQLVTLGPGVQTPMVHTAVQTPDGDIVDYRGVLSPDGAATDYAQWLYPSPGTAAGRSNWSWKPMDRDRWIEQWLPCGDPAAIELGGHDHPAGLYGEFELALTDYLARLACARVGVRPRGDLAAPLAGAVA